MAGYTTITAMYNGFTGAPGWTRMKFQGELNVADATTAAGAMRTFLNSMSAYIPTSASYSWVSTAQIYNDSRELVNEVTMTTPPATVTGASGANYAGGSGTVCYWLTGAFHGGAKIKGRTYLVPLTSAAFFTDGTLATTARNTLQTAANALVAATPKLVISSHKIISGIESYATAVVNGASVPDRAAQLRSRRD
jgi:hypothetical protein